MRHFYLLLLLVSLPISLSGCGNDSSVSPAESSFAVSETCITCHKTSGTSSSVTLASITDEWSASKHSMMQGASCIDCHGSGNGHPSSCGGCHGGSTTAGLEFHNPAAAGRCYTCHTTLGYPHFANYTTSLAAQYVSQTDAAGVQCRQCHNPHDTTSLIQYNRDWAKSGHGDVHFVSGNASASSVNSHYPWTTAGRDACSKCHTTSGYKKFVSGGVAPLMSNNMKNEAIMCSACHQDYSWKRRNIGAQTLDYKYNGIDVVLPDAGDSNLCLVCHSGRGNGQSARPTRNGSTYHHAVAGAVLFSDKTHVGYEFDIDGNGNSAEHYGNPAHFKHNIIGMTNGAGPCVSCHMKSSNSHTFGVVTKDTTGAITSINTIALCNTCHTAKYALTPAKLEEESEGYRDAGNLLDAKLTAKGIMIPRTGTKEYIAALPANDYGAWLNSSLTSDEPGGFAHNRYYVKRLIFDSLDWLDNGAFDGTIIIDAVDYPHASDWFRADATTNMARRP